MAQDAGTDSVPDPATLLDCCERRIGYTFSDRISCGPRSHPCLGSGESSGLNERLEFLGDAILGPSSANSSIACIPSISKGI